MPDPSRSRGRVEPSKRNSITDRLLGTLNQVRNRDSGAAVQRHTSSVGKQSTVPRIREWLDSCNREHDHHCSPSQSAVERDPEGAAAAAAATFHPTWLIDSVDRCLVRAKPLDRYVAISYVWHAGPGHRRNADEEPIQLVKGNVDMFMDGLPETDIPSTIADAIWLSRKLGLKYVWVDRLCIVQDDEEEKEMHIKHMPDVFSNAYLTIVAAHGDASTGLLALNPRKSPPPRQGLLQGNQGGQNHDDLVLDSKWNTRGWTLQEYLYSRRCIFFFEDTVSWECHCELWEGSSAKPPRGKACSTPPSSAALGYRHAPWPDLDDYARIAMDYSARRLTYVDDTLKAISGITHLLSRVYPGGFVYGVPLMFLDIALLWRPQASIRRRAATKPPFLPSWSWLGWWFDGIPVDLVLWRAAADYVEETRMSGKGGLRPKRLQASHSFKFKSTITLNLTDRQATFPVPSTGLQYRELRSRKTPSAALPPGWSKSGSSHFKYDRDEDTVFKYPVPVEEPPQEGGYEPPTGELAYPGPLLSFRTMSASFEVDYEATLAPRDVPNPVPLAVGNIWSKTNRWAGQFRGHDGWLGIQSSNYDGDETLEFIAISTVTERRGSHVFTEEQFQANKDQDEFIDIVNVLWIERIGGIAYRRGLGHILQKAWDAQQKEEVDILLG